MKAADYVLGTGPHTNQSTDGRFYVTNSFQGLTEFGGNAFTSADDVDVIGLEAL